MILSIAMIVKNEEKYLDKTLSALKPLMEEIESELIIVDTGSTDKTIEIAKKYTDKVYFREWTGNFAEMRNESFKYATGEWILVLDADEELVEYGKFIEFIKSKDSKVYKSLGVSLKNYSDENLTKYTRAPLLRIFKNEKGFKYKGSIHEQPVYKLPIYNPVDGVMVFNHYGYIFEDESIRQRKMKRNEEILIKELEKDSNNPYINYQMGQNYMVLNKASEAIFHLEKSVKEYEKKNIIYIPAYTELLSCYYFTNQNLEIENLCQRYLKKDKKNIDVYYYLATAQMNMYKYDKSAENYKKYIYYIENYNLSTQASDITCSFDTEKYEINAVNNYCKILIRFKKYDEAYMLIEKTISKYSEDLESTTKLYKTIIELLHSMNRIEDLLVFYKKFSEMKVIKNIFLHELELYLITIKDVDKEKFYRVLSNLDGNYGILNKCRLGQEIGIENLVNILEFEKEDYYGDIIYEIFKRNQSLNMLKNISSIKLSKYLTYMFVVHKESVISVYEYIKDDSVNLNIENLRIKSVIESSLINDGKLSVKERYTVFKKYMTDRYRVLKSYYRKDVIDIDILNNVDNTLDYIVIKLKIIKDGMFKDNIKFLQDMKSLMIEFPKFKDIINFELEEGIEEIQKFIKYPNEMNQLKSEFILMIEKEVEKNNIFIAENYINQYIEINGIDDRILNISALVELMKGNINKATEILKEAFNINPYNYDTIYNIAYIKKDNGELEDALDCYNCILRESDDLDILNQVKEDLELINF